MIVEIDGRKFIDVNCVYQLIDFLKEENSYHKCPSMCKGGYITGTFSKNKKVALYLNSFKEGIKVICKHHKDLDFKRLRREIIEDIRSDQTEDMPTSIKPINLFGRKPL